MLIDGIALTEGSVLSNLTVQSGTTYPISATIGELFYRTDAPNVGLYCYDGSTWQITADSTALTTHIADTSLHLTSSENTWIDAITATSTEVNYLSGVTSSVQSQFGGKVSKTGDTLSGNLDLGNNNIISLASPVSASDAATKQYVDNVATGLNVKQSVRAATTANITLSGTQTIDGVAVIAGDRVLVKNQTTAAQNGIYIAAAGAWARSVDTDNSPAGEVVAGIFTFVTEGTLNADTGWTLTTNNPITLGTTDLTFTQFSSSISGVSTFNTRTGAVTLSSGDVTTALTYTPYNATNPSSYITGVALTDDGIYNAYCYPMLSATTSGPVSGARLSSTKLTFHPAQGNLAAPAFVGNGYNITGINPANITGGGLIPVAALPTATSSTLGAVKIDGTTITINGSGVISSVNTYTLPVASTSSLGGVKVDGTTVTINGAGVISSAGSYTLPTASASVLGGIKIGSGLSIDGSGVVTASGGGSLPTQTGNSGKYLTTDGTTASWGTVASGGGSGSSTAVVTRATMSANQTVTSGVMTKILFNGTTFDTTGAFNTTTNRFQPATAGYYEISGWISPVGSTVTIVAVNLYKNGSAGQVPLWVANSGMAVGSVYDYTDTVYMNGTTDYLEIYGQVSGTGTTQFQASNTIMQAKLISGVGGSNITPVVFKGYPSSAQSLTSNTWTKVNMNAASIDTAASLDAVNYRFNPKTPGYYQIDFLVNGTGGSGYTRIISRVDMNGTTAIYSSNADMPSTNNAPGSVGNGILYMNGSTDYLELFAFMTASSPSISANQAFTYLAASLITASTASSSAIAASAYRGAVAQTLTANQYNKIQLNSEFYDTNNAFDTGVNYRFTAPQAGYYSVNGNVSIVATSGHTGGAAAVYKNGVYYCAGNYNAAATAQQGNYSVATNMYLNIGDYLELWGYGTGTGLTTNTGTASVDTHLDVVLVAGNQAQTQTPVVFRAQASATQALTTATYTVINLDTATFDTAGSFISATKRFSPKIAGHYQISAGVYLTGVAITSIEAHIYKNGAAWEIASNLQPSGTIGMANVGGIVYLNGTTDYLTLIGYYNGTSASTNNNPALTFMDGHLISATATPAAVAFRAQNPASNQSITAGAWTKVTLTVEGFDTNNYYDAPNSKFMPTLAGYYYITGSVNGSGTGLSAVVSGLYKNGVLYKQGNTSTTGGSATVFTVDDIVFMNGSTDYIELWGLVGATSGAIFTASGCVFSGFLISSQGAPATVTNVGTVKVGSGLAVTTDGTLSTSSTVPQPVAGCVFNGIAAGFTVNKAWNGTLTRISAGLYQFTFTTAMADTNYGVVIQDNCTANQLGHSQVGSVTTTGFRVLHFENQVATDTGPQTTVIVYN